MRWAATHPAWCLGFEDETWWSRLARPALHAWAEADRPLRLVEQPVAKDDPDPPALACYGRWLPDLAETWRRFVDGLPVSTLTTHFLAWCCEELAARGTTALLLVWDHAGWHISHEVQAWLRDHNRHVRQAGAGYGSLVACCPARARGSIRSSRSGGMRSAARSNPTVC